MGGVAAKRRVWEQEKDREGIVTDNRGAGQLVRLSAGHARVDIGEVQRREPATKSRVERDRTTRLEAIVYDWM